MKVPPHIINRIYHEYQQEVADFLCVGEEEDFLVKAKRIVREQWHISKEIFDALSSISRYRKALIARYDDNHFGHWAWVEYMGAVRQCRKEGVQVDQAFLTATVNGEDWEVETAKDISKEQWWCQDETKHILTPLHSDFPNGESMLSSWRINDKSVKPFVAHIKESLQPHT